MHSINQPSARLIVLDPGHFHAALVQKESYQQLDPRVSVYAPLGPELLDYLSRIYLFNTRKPEPTRWDLDIHCTDEPLTRMLSAKPGNVVVLAGKNDTKIDRIRASIQGGLNVLADKPWIISSADLPKLEASLRLAEEQQLVAYDIMTERYEVTSQLQRELVNTPDIFGTLDPGTAGNPGINARSVHNIMKLVSGLPLRRPAWFFDINIQGEALADVGTHVVDLVQWTAFADCAINYRADVQVLDGRRWPLILSPAQFQTVTGETLLPDWLESNVHEGNLHYFCNNSVHYKLRGIHVKMDILWDWQAPEGAGDVYEASFRGTRSRIEVRQGRAENHRPELSVVPSTTSSGEPVFSALHEKIGRLQSRWPGLDSAQIGDEVRILIPDEFRVGHEAHFAQVTRRFFDYLAEPSSMPVWETPNMLAKYHVTTRGVELARENFAGRDV
jgi:predicted dehydrogenase